MRIINWLALGLGTAAIATAAPARPGTGSFSGGSSQAGAPNAAWNHAGQGGYFRFGPGAWKDERRYGRHRGRLGGRGWSGYDPYGGVGIGGPPVGGVDPNGNGFFNGGGGRIGLRGGRPYYDYDRGYPYEWDSPAARRNDLGDEAARVAERPARCTMENGVRVCRGW
ncbi:MAG TPA: hypothetical protein VF620_03660 [Allosphingosinicella sp.]|jgi:hypothetical protein